MNAVPTPQHLPEGLRLRQEADIITLCDANTTVGYCRYSPEGEIEYVFVQSSRRRRGVARLMLEMVQKQVKVPLRFRGPFSPGGEALVTAWCARPPASSGTAPRHAAAQRGHL